ncbi:nucleotide exchange factor GrpE [Bifidobacterium sp. ESL0728]|uniref:nucleotide exchange factor GrpE n=1 Tax=Bifidobacterium sp. ESL0728 TaxID=2983220 RepID=UPI0023F7521B|nr:nucleotide exchange factor GrpE [Bifidobacterium sp. ESL0728]WEV59163.1 nucleotide exchange factor GrpE [Bifidobacterium sp. ESL0728]
MSGFDKDDYLKDLPDPDDAWLNSMAGFNAPGEGFGGSPDGANPAEPEQTSAGATGEKAGETMSSEQSNDKADDEAKQNPDGTAASAANNNDNTNVNDASAQAGTGQAGADNSQVNAAGAAAAANATNGDKATGDANKADATDTADGKDGENTLTPLGQAKKEAADYLDALQRERAEFVNFRNRSKKEQEIFRQHGIIDVLTALLPALDDIDRIREHSDLDDSFAAVANKIDKAFEKFGVEKFGKKGETFDPTKHEAILHKPDANATEETVDTVVEAGYRIGDRVIRAARVVVASPKA